MIPISIARLSASYNGTQVVHDLSLEVGRGSWLTLIGPNGAGKTTVLRAIAGLLDFGGEIRIGAEAVARIPRRALARLVAYVPQRPVIPLGATVTDYVLMGRNPYIPYLASESRSDLAIVCAVLERLDLGEFAHREVALLRERDTARRTRPPRSAQQAPVLLLDEPTSALDVGHQPQVLELVDELSSRVPHGVSTMPDLTLAVYSEELSARRGPRGGPRALRTRCCARPDRAALRRLGRGRLERSGPSRATRPRPEGAAVTRGASARPSGDSSRRARDFPRAREHRGRQGKSRPRSDDDPGRRARMERVRDQFIKSGKWKVGEEQVGRQLGGLVDDRRRLHGNRRT